MDKNKKNKAKFDEDLSSTAKDDLTNNKTATPLAKPLDAGEQAFQLATSNKQEIDMIKKEMLEPSWLKDFVSSANSIIYFIKIIVAIFLLLLIFCLIIFIAFSYTQLDYLIIVLERIRDSKSMEINQELLKAFNDFYNYAEKIIKVYFNFMSGILLISILVTFFLRISKDIIDQRKK